MDAPETSQREQVATALFREPGGMLKTGQALGLGIHPRTLYSMRDSGALERITRGVYRLADLPPLSDPDLVSVATRIPQGVICLISALAFHRLTREIPHYVYVALPRGAEPPRLEHPPLRVFWLTEPVFRAGIETHMVDGVSLQCLYPGQDDRGLFQVSKQDRHRSRGRGPQDASRTRRLNPDELLHFARICRVETVIKPYLQALA